MAFKEIPKPAEAVEDVTTLRIRIEGTVQGVGFRAFVLREASALRLMGWVRNRMDGTLEALASGPTKKVEALITSCMKGPRGARVANIDLFVADAPTDPGFTLRPTL
jgi:acylphosphatase